MLLVAPVRPEHRRLPVRTGAAVAAAPPEGPSDMPAVTHVDYSARVQTVGREATRASAASSRRSSAAPAAP